MPRCGNRRFGRRAGGVRSLLFRYARPQRSGHSLRPGATSGARPQEHSLRSGKTLYPHAGLRSGRRDAGHAQLHLHHPAQPGHGLSQRHFAVVGTARAPRAASADRLLLSLPGPRSARAGHLHRALRHRQRRLLGSAGGERRRRHGNGQNPNSTEYDGMPRSAIATGLVDYVLQPAEMPAQIIAYVAHAFGRSPLPVSAPAHQTEDALKKVFVLLRAHTGHDFSEYKRNTIARRVKRRMAVHQIERLERYVTYLQQTPAEVEALFRDLLIGVTSFFRDPEAFDALREHANTRILAGKSADTLLRAWVPACSTGEEAYSIAMLFQERLEELKLSPKVQVFATDIDRN